MLNGEWGRRQPQRRHWKWIKAKQRRMYCGSNPKYFVVYRAVYTCEWLNQQYHFSSHKYDQYSKLLFMAIFSATSSQSSLSSASNRIDISIVWQYLFINSPYCLCLLCMGYYYSIQVAKTMNGFSIKNFLRNGWFIEAVLVASTMHNTRIYSTRVLIENFIWSSANSDVYTALKQRTSYLSYKFSVSVDRWRIRYTQRVCWEANSNDCMEGPNILCRKVNEKRLSVFYTKY